VTNKIGFDLDLLLNNVAIERVEETKLLGVTLDSKQSWSKHIDSMVTKMGRGLSMIVLYLLWIPIRCCKIYLSQPDRSYQALLFCWTWTTVQLCGQFLQRRA
jgi:hypothetical protein